MDRSLPGSSVHGISKQEYCSGLPFPSPEDISDPGIKPTSLALAVALFTTDPPGKPNEDILVIKLKSPLMKFTF